MKFDLIRLTTVVTWVVLMMLMMGRKKSVLGAKVIRVGDVCDPPDPTNPGSYCDSTAYCAYDDGATSGEKFCTPKAGEKVSCANGVQCLDGLVCSTPPGAPTSVFECMKGGSQAASQEQQQGGNGKGKGLSPILLKLLKALKTVEKQYGKN